MRCKKHPTYKGIRPTKLQCCKPVYYWRAMRKFLGLPVAEAKPRAKAAPPIMSIAEAKATLEEKQ